MNIQAMMKQAKKMQEEIDKEKSKLAEQEFTVEKQGIKIIAMGNKRIKKVEINEALIDPEDKDIIEDLLMIAVNEVMEIIEEHEEALMPKQGGMPF